MNVDMFAKLLGNEDKASVFMEEPSIKYQTEINAWVMTIVDILINNDLTTIKEFEKSKEKYIKEISDETKKQIEKHLNKIIK